MYITMETDAYHSNMYITMETDAYHSIYIVQYTVCTWHAIVQRSKITLTVSPVHIAHAHGSTQSI